jgi:beta-barrel assembly-enhancing protease
MSPGYSSQDIEGRCPTCGATAVSDARFCGICGAAQLPPGFAPTPAAVTAPPGEIAWEIDMPLLTSRFILYDFGKVFLWTALFMIVLLSIAFALAGEFSAEDFLMITAMTGLAVFILALLVVFVMAVFFNNRYRASFVISEQGVGYESRSRRGKWANRAAIAAGALSGRPGVAGAGLLAASQESMAIGWSEIQRVNEHAADRVFSLRNSWRVVLRLHCTPENYASVRALLAARLPAGTIVSGPGVGGAEPFRRFLLGAAAWAAIHFSSASPEPLPWIVAAAFALAASGWFQGGVRTLLSLAAAAAAAVQLAAWPGGLDPVLSSGWNAIPAAIGFAAFAAAVLESFVRPRQAAAAVILAAMLLAPAPASAADRQKPPWQGLNFFSIDDELALGRKYSADLDRRLPLVTNSDANAAVDRIGRRLAAHAPRPAEWRFSVVNTREVNAFAVPGGFIYVNRGLIDLAETEDELAGVLAHEIAHVVARHSTRAMSKQLLLAAVAMGASLAVSRKSDRWGDIIATAGGAGVLMAGLKYSRNDEYQADRLGAEIMQAAGYSPHGLTDFFEKLRGESAGRGTSRGARFLALVSTHPPTGERIARLKPLLANAPPPAVQPRNELTLAQAALRALPFPDPARDSGLSGAVSALAREPGQPTTPAPSSLEWRSAHRIRVPGNTVWLSTGLSVRRNNAIAIQAEGEIQPIKGSDDACGPDGLPGASGGFFKPISRANTGALLARVKSLKNQTSPPVLIGEGASFTAPFDGILELGINDDNNFDNRGEFQTQILIRRGGAR